MHRIQNTARKKKATNNKVLCKYIARFPASSFYCHKRK